MVFMPPRHGKSEMISHWFPVWWLGTFPDQRVIMASYGAEFAAQWGRKARNTYEEWAPELWGLSVDEASHAADRWDIKGRAGGMTTTGIGGPITGRGADLLIIDDPVKDSEEAWSSTIQARNAAWWDGTAYTRLEPGGVVVVLMTRWHENDLAGYILRNSGEPWEVLRLPALADGEDELGRRRGEALWPERFSREALDTIRRELSKDDIGYYWEAEYQQRPAIPEGLLFFSRAAIEAGLARCKDPIERIETRPAPGAPADGYVLVWERPLTSGTYYIGADTADGKGEALGTWGGSGGPDRNAAAVYKWPENVQVAEIYGRQEEHQYARVLAEWGNHYRGTDGRPALLAVERNRRSVLVALRELNYGNLYATPRATDMHLLRQGLPTQLEYGWNTDVKTRPLLLADLREAMSTGAQVAMSRDYYAEALTFVQGDPPAAAPGQHDDRIFAHAIAWQARKQLRAPGPAGGLMQQVGVFR